MNRRPALGFIFVTLFLDVLGIGLIIPILPKLVENFHGGNTSKASITVGVLSSLYALMQFVFAPILGNLSDRYGRRPVILGSLFGGGLDYILLAFAPNLVWFYVGRVIAGMSGANFTAATAYIADISTPEKRAANFGIIGAAFGLGFITGPALGGWLGATDLKLPFLVAAGLSLTNWLYGFFVLPESLAVENRRRFDWKRANPLGSLLALSRYPMVGGLALSTFLGGVAMLILHSLWAIYTEYRFQWSPKAVGGSLAFVGLLAAIVQGGLARLIVPKLGEIRSVKVGLTLVTFSYVGYAFSNAGWMMFLPLLVGCMGGIAQPAIQALVAHRVPANEQGAVQGAMQSLMSVAGVIGPLMGTQVFAFFIGPSAPFVFPGAPFLVSAVLASIALTFVVRTLNRFPSQSGNSSPAATTADLQTGH
jgi:DHA1 family tetracycline resistance protein-like MFS transporter